MKRRYLKTASVLGLMGTMVFSTAAQAKIDYIELKPADEMVNTSVRNCNITGTIRVPGIAWGADITLSLANGNAKRTARGSIMADQGLDLQIYRQDNFAQQLSDYMSCKTPYLRGTVGMVSSASDLLNADPRTKPVYIFKYSWSAGGDAMVVRDGINSPQDLRGKTIAVQWPGPHMDYLLKVLADAGLSPSDVKIKYVKDLLEIDDDSMYAAKALREDSGVDAAMVIIPDALALTSDGNVGTGAEGSVKGAKILLSTKTANRIISDVYVVRKDYFDANRDDVEAFTRGLFKAEEALRPMMKRQSGADYKVMIGAAAEFLLDSKNAVADAEAMYADAEMDGYPGNKKWFGDRTNPRGFKRLTNEAQQSFVSLGVLSKTTPAVQASWDYNALAKGLSNTAAVEAPKFSQAGVTRVLERRARQGSTQEGVLFDFEIYFKPGQSSFPVAQYESDFKRVVDLASTYGGAILSVEGHSDPLGYLKQKKAGASPSTLSKQRQAGKNLSMGRSNTVVDTVIGYASSTGVTMDPSQFGPIGYGYGQPNTPNCSYGSDGDIELSCAPANENEWNATRRVVFKVIQVEAEAEVFSPL